MKKFINKPSYLTVVGAAMLLVGPTILEFLLFALASALVGEHNLENDHGLTPLGTIVVYLPYVASILLIIYDLFLRKTKVALKRFPFKKFGLIAAISGLVLIAFGYVSLITTDPGLGANIGAGFLILGGGLIVIFGFLALLISVFMKKQRLKL